LTTQEWADIPHFIISTLSDQDVLDHRLRAAALRRSADYSKPKEMKKKDGARPYPFRKRPQAEPMAMVSAWICALGRD
jgi:hypothetical protein